MSLRRFGTGLALIVAGAFLPAGAQAAPVGGAPSTNIQIDPHAMVEKAQVFHWRGRRYCFYWDAWNGPGWYHCGYAWRRGFGWGGGPGWHGWRHYDRGPRRRGRVERPRRPDRGVNRPRRSDRATGRPSRPDRASPRRGGGDRASPRGGGRSVAPRGGGGRSAAPSGRGGGGSMSRGGGGGGGRGGEGRGR